MEKRINLAFVLCSDYDETQKNVVCIQNEVYAHENKVNLKFLILVNGIFQEEKKRSYDFLLKCVDPNRDMKGKSRYLFTFNLEPDESVPGDSYEDKTLKSAFEGAISEVAFTNISVKFPCDGRYEIHAYEVDEDAAAENARERLRKRGKATPQAIYPFRVIFN